MGPGLTPKQQVFCREYVRTGDPTAAYRAGYACEAMSPVSIRSAASRLLKNATVSQQVARLQDHAARRQSVTVDRVIAEYAKLAFTDIRKAFDDAGNLKPIHELDDDVAGAIAGIEFEDMFEWQGSGEERERVHTGRLAKIRLVDKRAALDSLGKYLGLFQEPSSPASNNAVTLQLVVMQAGQQAIPDSHGALQLTAQVVEA